MRDEDVVDPGATITWESMPAAAYSVEYSTDLENWPEITDALPSEGEQTTLVHKFLPAYPELENAPQVYYRIRLDP